MRKWLIASLALALLLSAGCRAHPTQPPTDESYIAQPQPGPDAPLAAQPATPPPATSPEQPASPATPDPAAGEKPAKGCDLTEWGAPLEFWGGFVTRRADMTNDCRFLVDTGEIQVQAQVGAEDAAGALRAVQVVGVHQTWSAETMSNGDGKWNAILHLDRGVVGDEIRVTVTRPNAPAVTATLVRQAGPTVQVQWQQDDTTWTPLASGASLPPGPKRLRFHATGGVNLAYLQTGVHAGTWQQHLTPDEFTVLPTGDAELLLRTPPPLVQIDLGGAIAADGLAVPQGTITHFYLGAPPVLAIMTLSTGESRTIGAAPPSIYQTVVRKDGRYAALVAPTLDSDDGFQVWLSDLATGKLTDTPFRCGWLADLCIPSFDAKGRLVAPLEGGHIGLLDPSTGAAQVLDSAATEWAAFSPDGRYAAGRGGAQRGFGLGAWIGPTKAVHLVVRELLQGTEQVFPWPGYIGGLTWLPDGQLLLGSVNSNREPSSGADTASHLFTVDLHTGAWTPYAGKWPERAYEAPPAAYHAEQPGDRFLSRLAGERALVVRWSNPSPLRTWRGP